MTRDEILKAVIALCDGCETEEEDIALANRLRRELPHSKIIDLIFQDMRNLNPEQVVDEAFRRHAYEVAKGNANTNRH